MLLYYILVEGPCPVVHRSRSMTHSCWMLCIGQSVSSLFTNLCLFLYPCRGPMFIIPQARKYVVLVDTFLLNTLHRSISIFSIHKPLFIPISLQRANIHYSPGQEVCSVCRRIPVECFLFTKLCILIFLQRAHVQ